MHTITLYLENGHWMAKHTDPDVRRLFGTDTIPTPYLNGCDPIALQLEITKLNPDCWVQIRR